MRSNNIRIWNIETGQLLQEIVTDKVPLNGNHDCQQFSMCIQLFLKNNFLYMNKIGMTIANKSPCLSQELQWCCIKSIEQTSSSEVRHMPKYTKIHQSMPKQPKYVKNLPILQQLSQPDQLVNEREEIAARAVENFDPGACCGGRWQSEGKSRHRSDQYCSCGRYGRYCDNLPVLGLINSPKPLLCDNV